MESSFPDFRPHPLLRGGHRQTIAGAYWLQAKIPYQAQLHRIDLPDGDRLALHDDCPAAWQPGQRCVLLVHGLSGSHRSPYMVRIAAKSASLGYRTFRLDMRGCGAGESWAQHPGHAGRSEDVAAALQVVARLCPGSRVTMVGFSLGGNIVLKLAGEIGDSRHDNLDSVISVAPPVDLHVCSQNIGLRANRIYDQSFVRALLRQIETRRATMPALNRLKLTPRPRSLFEFDDRVTSILSGYSGSDEYYNRASSAPLLKNICLPTRILTAADDPLIPVEMFERLELSASTQIHIPQHGGHLGFVGVRGVHSDRHWLDWRICDWLQRLPWQT